MPPRRVTPRQECFAIIEAEHAEFFDYSDSEGLDVTVWAPQGLNWKATSCHSLSVCFYNDRPAAWRALLADLRMGTEPCDMPNCENCEEQP